MIAKAAGIGYYFGPWVAGWSWEAKTAYERVGWFAGREWPTVDVPRGAVLHDYGDDERRRA